MSQQNQTTDASGTEVKIIVAADRVFYQREDGQVFSTDLTVLEQIATEDDQQTTSLVVLPIRHEEAGLPNFGEPYITAPGTREGDALDEFTDAADDMDLADDEPIRDAA
ncbi:MAG TPA: hypothetical protein VGF17_24855 [Phytomonospora sp.]